MPIYEVGQKLRLKDLSGFEAQCAFEMPKNLLLLPGFTAEIVNVVRIKNDVFQYAEIHFDAHSDDVKFRVDWDGLAFFEKVTTEQLAEEDMELLRTIQNIRNARPSWVEQNGHWQGVKIV